MFFGPSRTVAALLGVVAITVDQANISVLGLKMDNNTGSFLVKSVHQTTKQLRALEKARKEAEKARIGAGKKAAKAEKKAAKEAEKARIEAKKKAANKLKLEKAWQQHIQDIANDTAWTQAKLQKQKLLEQERVLKGSIADLDDYISKIPTTNPHSSTAEDKLRYSKAVAQKRDKLEQLQERIRAVSETVRNLQRYCS